MASFAALTVLASVAWEQYYYIQSKTEAESDANRLEYYFRTYFGEAVDIIYPNPLPNPLGVAGTPTPGPTFDINVFNSMDPVVGNASAVGANGYLAADFNYTTIAAMPQWTTLAVFLREAGGTTADTGAQGYGGNLAATGVYFRRPEPATVAGPSTGGVVFFDIGAQGGALSPDFSDLYVPNVVSFSLATSGIVNSNNEPRATSIRVSYRIRYFFAGSNVKTFCPSADYDAGLPGCTDAPNYADVQRTFDVSLKNNKVKHRGVVPITGPVPNNPESNNSGELHYFHLVNPLTLGGN